MSLEYSYFKDFLQNYDYNQNQHCQHDQDREAGYEPHHKIYGGDFQLVQAAAESFLNADQNSIRVSGGENLDFLDGEVNGAVDDLVIQGAELGLQGF